MRYWVGVTDNSWFNFLSRLRPDEVNFWHPGGRPPFTQLESGAPFLFKLKRPNNHVAGGGYFVKFTTLPLSMVWDAFQEKNGALTKGEFERVITGESTLPVLEAAHIIPFASDGPRQVSNGLLLRSDFHKLFDMNLVTVTPSLHVRVSAKIEKAWFNGKAYSSLDGRSLANLPHATNDRPDPTFLRWHNERFDG